MALPVSFFAKYPVTGGGGASGANLTLSNLTSPTALKVNLLPDLDDAIALGSDLKRFTTLHVSSGVTSQNNDSALSLTQSDTTNTKLFQIKNIFNSAFETPSGRFAGTIISAASPNVKHSITIFTDGANGVPGTAASGNVSLETGNNMNGTSSGHIYLQTGMSDGVRGKVILNGLAIDVTNKQIINVGTPTLDTDAANKAYVDGASGSGADLTLSNLTSPTAIGVALEPALDDDINLGSPEKRWGYLHASGGILSRNNDYGLNIRQFSTGFTQEYNLNNVLNVPQAFTLPSGRTANTIMSINNPLFKHNIGIYTERNATFPGTAASGDVNIETGNDTNATSSGNIHLQTGTSTGVRGNVEIDANQLKLKTSKIVQTGSLFIEALDDDDTIFRVLAGGNITLNSHDNTTGGSLALTSTISYLVGVTLALVSSMNNGESRMEASGSGNVVLRTTQVGGVRGNVILDGLAIDVSSKQIKNLANPTLSTDAANRAYVDTAVAAGGSGANTSLSNLTTTSVNLPLNMNSNKISGLGAPTLATDAATRAYVDASVGPIANATGNYLVRVSTTVNIALSAPQTIDGVSVIAGDRVLVRNQTTASQNGVYVVAAGAWTRATDMDLWNETIGYSAHVGEGTAWAGMTFVSATTAGGTLGITNILWLSTGSTITSNNVASGSNALQSNTTGIQNTATGASSLRVNTTGSDNVATGFQALQTNMTGNGNTANGTNVLRDNTSGYNNTATGFQALQTNTTGYGNVATGKSALLINTTGFQNTANGFSALQVTTGNSNIGIGYNAGAAITTGGSNVVIGSNTGSSIATLSNNIILADGAGNIRISVDSTGIVDVKSKKIINVATPTLPQDAANMAYVDGLASTPTLARAQLLTSTAVPAAGIINFNNVLRDTQNRVTAGAAWKFTANFAGDYDVYGTMVASVETQLHLFKNGVFIQNLNTINNVTTTAFTNSVTLAPGDYLDFRLSTAAIINANASCVVNIKLIK